MNRVLIILSMLVVVGQHALSAPTEPYEVPAIGFGNESVQTRVFLSGDTSETAVAAITVHQKVGIRTTASGLDSTEHVIIKNKVDGQTVDTSSPLSGVGQASFTTDPYPAQGSFAAGVYSINGQALFFRGSTTGPSPSSAPTTLPVIAATFNRGTIKTGWNATGGNPVIKKTVTVTVEPKAQVNKVDVTPSGANRVTVANVQKNATTGEITFDVTGTSATPNNQPGGDTKIDARLNVNNNALITQADVIVLVPKRIGTPHPQANGVVAGVNRVLDGTTSPAAIGLAPGTVALGTCYLHWQTVQVWDQFQQPIDSLYAGSPVFEHNPPVPMNQTLAANGTYQDPVGTVMVVAVVAAGGPAANAWPAQPPVLPNPPNGQGVQNIPVSIAGHSLNPAVVNRTVQFSTANGQVTVIITWP